MRLLVLLLLLPLASAQTVAEIDTWVTPEEYFLPISIHPDDVPSVTLHVKGEIQCQPGTEAPAHLTLNYNGSSVYVTIEGEELTYSKVGDGDFNVTWSAMPNNRYVIDKTFELQIVREAIPDHDLHSTHDWDDVFAMPQGTLSCDPQGYVWNVNEKQFKLTVEGFGDIDSDGFEFPDRETPAPFALMLLALVALAVKKRE